MIDRFFVKDFLGLNKGGRIYYFVLCFYYHLCQKQTGACFGLRCGPLEPFRVMKRLWVGNFGLILPSGRYSVVLGTRRLLITPTFTEDVTCSG